MPLEVIRLPEELWQTRSIEAVVVAVHVALGGRVEPGTVVAEVETDKAVFEVESHVSGTVVEVHVRPGQRIRPGDPIVTVETQEAPAP